MYIMYIMYVKYAARAYTLKICVQLIIYNNVWIQPLQAADWIPHRSVRAIRRTFFPHSFIRFVSRYFCLLNAVSFGSIICVFFFSYLLNTCAYIAAGCKILLQRDRLKYEIKTCENSDNVQLLNTLFYFIENFFFHGNFNHFQVSTKKIN